MVLKQVFSDKSMQTVPAVIHSTFVTVLTVEQFIQILDEAVMSSCSLSV